MPSTNIAELLRGCEVGRIQTVGFMQVIPLISDTVNDRFVSPTKAKFSTRGYGEMDFDNESDQEMIVPAHTGYLVKQAAQNHAMCSAGLIKAKSHKQFTDAACIQQTQGGLISKGSHDMVILPAPLREPAYRLRGENSYSKLWPAITALNKKAGLSRTEGHLDYFLDHYADQLDQFVAEFEIVNKQVGAIILVNGKVIGIERVPNYEYWEDVWQPLIRECYGSMAILEARDNGEVPTPPKTRVALRRANSIEDLQDALDEASKEE